MNKEKIKEILIVICISYTIISLGIALFESITSWSDRGFIDLLFKFLWTAIGVCILYTHPLLEKLSPILMLLLQYAVAMLLVFISIWICSFWGEIGEHAYFEAFRSFTVIYIIGAVFYYIQIILDVKKQNRILEEIKRNNKGHDSKS
jgi:hypothetical protein